MLQELPIGSRNFQDQRNVSCAPGNSRIFSIAPESGGLLYISQNPPRRFRTFRNRSHHSNIPTIVSSNCWKFPNFPNTLPERRFVWSLRSNRPQFIIISQKKQTKRFLQYPSPRLSFDLFRRYVCECLSSLLGPVLFPNQKFPHEYGQLCHFYALPLGPITFLFSSFRYDSPSDKEVIRGLVFPESSRSLKTERARRKNKTNGK